MSRLAPPMAVFAIAGLLVGACGSAAAPAASPPRTEATIATSPSAAASPAPQPDVMLAGSRYGAILFDGSGRTLYLFSADGGTDSHCYNACATAWPPFVIAHAPIVGQGLVQGTVSTTARTGGGDQVVYAGHPLYYYAGDHAPGDIKCQAVVEFGGGWYVIDGNGNKITRP